MLVHAYLGMLYFSACHAMLSMPYSRSPDLGEGQGLGKRRDLYAISPWLLGCWGDGMNLKGKKLNPMHCGEVRVID